MRALISSILILASYFAFGQIGQRCPICPPRQGVATDSSCLIVVNGVAMWGPCGSGESPAWNLTGNTGTTAGTNFIGTTDNRDLVFKTFGVERLRLYNNGGGAMEINGNRILFTDSANGLSIGIDTSEETRRAFLAYEDDTVNYAALVNQYGVFFTHYNRTDNLLNGFINVLHYENNMARIPGTGIFLFISNTDTDNAMSIRDSVADADICKLNQGANATTIMHGFGASTIRFNDTAVTGVYSSEKWYIDSTGNARFTGITTTASLRFSNKSINTTAGDAATINASSGRFRKDTSGDTFTLTNNLITANSIIILTPANAALDATATQWTVSVSSNTATIVFDAAPTANFDMSFIVTN